MDDRLAERLQRLKLEIAGIRRGVHRGRVKPHKPVLLLAALDLLGSGSITENRISFDDMLVARFESLFLAIKQEGDWCHPSEPFFHLRTSGFWFHKPRPGKEKHCAEMDTSGGGSRRVLEMIEYAFFDPGSFSVLCDPAGLTEVIRFTLSTFFSDEERDRLAPLLTDMSSGIL